MSLSLSSLLNPSPDTETRAPSPPPQESLPPIQYVHSPEEQPRQDAAAALATLSASPVAPPQQWNGYSAQDSTQLERQRSWERRQSAYGDTIQLPPPPASGVPRKLSSPTLDHYHVASRSPEQRRPSIVSPTQSNITLPPLQGFASAPPDQTRRTSQARNDDILNQQQHPAVPSRAEDGSLLALQSQASKQPAIIEDGASSPAAIKQETAPTPQPSSPSGIDVQRSSDMEHQTLKAVSSLKNEHGLRTQSPLREASVPVPTTETAVLEPQPTASKKRPAPARTKKGTATTMKKEKAPPSKKRKVEHSKRSTTPSSQTSKPTGPKGASAKGTPMNSSPAPSARSYSGEPNEEPYDDDDDEDMEDDDPDADVYCICRKPDNGTFMIGCDGQCDDWFHGKCVGIEERDKNLIDKYICPNCTSKALGRTTFKRICRRSGCRQPARTGRTKNGNNGSKYCSEECGVLYFRDMVSRTRGREESAKSRSSRRKGSVTDHISVEDELGARGGALSAGEVKSLLDVSKTAEDFRKLGDGVLSPPATPDGKDGQSSSEYTDSEAQDLRRIQLEKEDARRRHALLKDRMKFVTLVKQAASRTAVERELKPKEYCGYDPRIEWIEGQFQAWRSSKIGQQAFELDTLQVEKSSTKDKELPEELESTDICDRKKCARHLEWSKLAIDDLRFEMSDNGDRMRALDKEEKEIQERAALRAKAGHLQGEGEVEIHGLGIDPNAASASNGDKIHIESPPKTNGVEPMETVGTEA